MFWKKGLVIGIIVMFIGISVVPSSGKIDGVTSRIIIEDGSLLGYVYNLSGKTIEGALIRVYFHETYREDYSDSNGYYHVIDIPICYCLKNATCSKEPYKTECVLLGIVENTTHDFVLFINQPPNKPVVTGETNGTTATDYEYIFTTDDPEGNDIWYFIEWGDGWTTGWVGPYSSGTPYSQSRMWIEGNFTIRCKAKDIFDAESDWGTLEVTMPVNQHSYSFPLLQRLLELFPNVFPILRQLLGL